MKYEDLQNCAVGQIVVPDKMVSDYGWENIERQVIERFKLFVMQQPNEQKAWRLAVWDAYCAWNGLHSLDAMIKRDEVFA